MDLRPIAAAVWLVGMTAPADGEGYVAAYVGGAATQAADVRMEQKAAGDPLVFEEVPFSGRSFESPIYYGYRAGFYFTRHFGVEAEFIHLKIYADLARMRPYFEQFEVSHGLNMVLVNAVMRRSLLGSRDPMESRLVFVARAGLGPTIPRPEVIVLGVAGGGYEAGPIAVQGAAGVEARLWRGLHVLTEYKYTFTPTSFDIPNGRASMRVHSHHVVTGLGVYF